MIEEELPDGSEVFLDLHLFLQVFELLQIQSHKSSCGKLSGLGSGDKGTRRRGDKRIRNFRLLVPLSPAPNSQLPLEGSVRTRLLGYASLRCFDEIDQGINFRGAAHLGF